MKFFSIIFGVLFLLFSFYIGRPTHAANFSIKKGVGGENRNLDLKKLGVSWAYAWYPCEECFSYGDYEHVPMIAGEDYNQDVIRRIANNHRNSYWLIWNEPNYYRQSNISPTVAAQIYRQLRPLIKNTDPGAKLIVGGVLWLDTNWLTNFRNEYYRLYGEWPQVEGWHVHHYVGRTEYGNTISSTEWRQRLEAVKTWMNNNGGQVELWLTEFGCLNSESVAYQIMQDQVPWLEEQSWITRYAWYASWSAGESCPNCTGALFTTTLPYDLTALGQLYASFGSSTCPKEEFGNLNCDLQGLIDVDDLTILLNQWGPNNRVSDFSSSKSADLNKDGYVDVDDLTRLLNHWQTSPI